VITGVARRRHWATDAKLRIIEESFEPGETVSSVARAMASRPIFFTAGGAC
jgi:transposase